MRVTKLIREFVEEEIEKAIPIDNLCPEFTEMEQKMEERVGQIVQTLRKQTEQLCQQARAELNLPSDWELKPACYRYVDRSSYGSELYIQNQELKSAARERREKVLKTVLLDMELGEVNKKNLSEAIAKAISEN